LKLGSLFDGIGGFPLAAIRHGITPVWASEIEAAPISITKRHFPDMKHLGDITKINGAEIEPVDIITFGSPCQDLSVAGKQAGMKGERSGLFMEAIRVIKEMREKTDGEYPTRIIWENVPGAFSSNRGEDFRVVIEEIAKISGGGATSIPRPPAKDKSTENSVWESAGTVVGDGWSLAWRKFDAQYWGVPQRRKRIFLVADFSSECAAEILFKPDCLSGDSAESGETGEGVTGNAKEGVRKTVPNTDIVIPINTQNSVRQDASEKRTGLGVGNVGGPSFTLQEGHHHAVAVMTVEPGIASRDGGHYYENIAGTLRANAGDNQLSVILENHGNDSRVDISEDNVVQTLTSRMGTGGGNVPMVMSTPIYAIAAKQIAQSVEENISPPIMANDYKEPNAVAYCIQGNTIERSDDVGANGKGVNEDVSFTLNTTDRHAVAYDCRNHIAHEEISGTLQAKDNGGQSLNYINPVFSMQGFGDYKQNEVASALKRRDGKDSTDLIYCSNGDKCNAENETRCRKILFELWSKTLQETLFKWKTGGRLSIQTAQILQQELHGRIQKEESEFNYTKNNKAGAVDGTTSEKCRYLRDLWQAKCYRCASQGQEYKQQPAGKFTEGLPELPHQDTSSKTVMQNMWQADEGLRILRETLSAIQKIWQPLCLQEKPAQSYYAVRRLTPVECERLQGFPDNYTAYGNDNNKISDSARYKALGNSLALPCVDFIFWAITGVAV
jgi:site-specific DNA-cytosine methylase